MKKYHSCSRCQANGEKVKAVTLRNQLKFPMCVRPLQDAYFYCPNRNCDLVYFSENEQYFIDDLQTKRQIQNKTICFCFGIEEKAFINYVQEHGEQQFYQQLDNLAYNTKCHCKFKNPSGRGCLRIFKTYAFNDSSS